MTDEKILAKILMKENLAIYDETGDTGNIFIAESPEILQNEIDYTIRKTGGRRVIRKLTGAREVYITIYSRGKDFEQISERLEAIASKLLNREYEVEGYFVENVFVYSEPQWLETDDNGNYLFNMTLTLTII